MPSKNFKEIIVGICFILLVFPVVVHILRLPLWIKLLVWMVYLLFFMYSGFILWFFRYIQKQNKTFIEARGENILIIAPHQDDCVAVAGGYAIQTVEKGGHVHILYTTDGYKDDKVTRRQEAVNAWSILGETSVTLDFLQYNNNLSFLHREEIDKGIDEIGTYIKKINPDTIFIPLYEGGHYQHDVTNYMVSEALRKLKFNITVYESPIYNFFMSFKTTPEKILSGLARFIPFVRYDYPPEPVQNDQVYFLKMTDAQLQKKENIIAGFRTQSPKKLIERWDFYDRYQKLHEYDYTQPPFDYNRSYAKKVHTLKSFPLIGSVMKKVMIWTSTIHPDPDYTITKIPFL